MLKYIFLSFIFLNSSINTKLSGDDSVPEELIISGLNNNSNKTYNFYIGTYTNENSKGIYLAKFNPTSGKISKTKLLVELRDPTYQYISNHNKYLWSICKGTDQQGMLKGYEINKTDGSLTEFIESNTGGIGPCYVSLHRKTNNVVMANYGDGVVSNLPIDKKGKKIGTLHTILHEGKGPVESRQKSPHAHYINTDNKGKFIYSADLGTDKIEIYTINKNQLQKFKEIKMIPGSGPRHIDFHPSNKAMAVVNELNNSVVVYTLDKDGCFTVLQSITSTIPDSFTGKTQCADIHYSPDGKYLYASNRGHNSIVSFKVDRQSMGLEVTGWASETIDWPRNFSIDPTGKYILVASQNSDNISVFEIDENTGKLKFTGNQISISKPVCITFLK